MIPMRTVVRLNMRLRNQKMLTRTSEAVGVKAGIERLCGVMTVPFALPSSWVRIRDKSTSVGSRLRALYDSIIKAVTTAEKRPAFQRIWYQVWGVVHEARLTKIRRFWTSSFHASHLALSFSIRGSNSKVNGFPSILGSGYSGGSPILIGSNQGHSSVQL